MVSDGSDYFFDAVARARRHHLIVHEHAPASLREAMPDRRYDVPGTGGTHQHSELVVVGRVVEVRTGPAFAHGPDDTIHPVAFDDPAAVEHAFDVVLRVDEELGAVTGADTVTFRVGALNASDLGRYQRSLQALGQVVVFLRSRQDRDATVWIPIEQGAFVGLVSEAGELRFPAVDGDRPGSTDATATLDQLRTWSRS